MSEPTTTQRRRQAWLATAAALSCGLMAVHLNDRREDEHTLRQANEAGAAGRYDEARRLAGSLQDGVTAADARYVEALAALNESRISAARDALRETLDLRPNDWRPRRDLAAVLLFLGDRGAARVEYGRALALNPRMPPLLAFDTSGREPGGR